MAIATKRNITERKQAGETIHQSEEKYKRLFELSPIGITTLNMKGVITDCNPAVYREGGYTADELVGKHFSQIAPLRVSDIPKQIKMFSSIIRGKTPEPFEIAYTRKDGTTGWTEVHVSLLKANGKKLGIQVLQRDVTDRKQAEEVLQTEKNKLQSIINAMEDGLTIQDADYNIIYQNELLRKIFGDHLGEKCYRVYEGREKLCDGCPLEKAFKDGKSHTSERKVVMPSGEVAFWENTANPVRDAKGNIVSCLEITRNTTERKQAEEKLRLLSSVTQQVSDATLVTDLDFNITYVNKATQDLLGYSIEEVLGKHLGSFNAKPLPESLEQELEQTVTSGKLWVGEMVKRRKDGSTFLGKCHISPLYDKQGKISSYIDVMHDITDRKRAEETIHQQNEFLNNILNSLTHPFYVIDANDYTVKMANLAAELGDLSENQTCLRSVMSRHTQKISF
ncbi:hypothetical protein ES708_01253 [subsurface metagenome]